MCCILSPAPFDLIYLLLDFERFKIIKFWLVRLKFCIEFIFASFFLEEKRRMSMVVSEGVEYKMLLWDFDLPTRHR